MHLSPPLLCALPLTLRGEPYRPASFQVLSRPLWTLRHACVLKKQAETHALSPPTASSFLIVTAISCVCVLVRVYASEVVSSGTMRGNLYSRGFDPMKSRSERRKEKQAKLAKTKRVIRLKRRLGRIAARKFAGQEDSHMTALMESYILRRKAERAAEKAKEASKDGTGGPGETGLAGEGSGAEESEMDEDEGSDSSSLDSGADSAFEVHDADDDGEEEDISSSRRRAVQRKQAGFARGGTAPRRGGASLAAKKDTTAPGGRHGRGGGAGRGRQGFRGGHLAQRGGRGSARGGQSAHNRQNTSRNASCHQRSPKVPTRSLY